MITERLHKALNDQMNFEFYSAHVYMQMAAYATDRGYDGIANFFLCQEQEERSHGMKFYNYLGERNLKITITGFELDQTDFGTILNLYQEALRHERVVTSRIYNLADIAGEEREHGTTHLLTWFINEQLEEEATFTKHIRTLEHIEERSNDMLQFDQEMAARVFVDTTQTQV